MGTVPTKAQGDGAEVLYLSYWMGDGQSVPFPVRCFGVPANWNGTGSITAQLIVGAGAIPSGILLDSNSDAISDGWTFMAAIFVEDNTIYDILALTAWNNEASGGLLYWGAVGGAPQPIIMPGGIVTPSSIVTDGFEVDGVNSSRMAAILMANVTSTLRRSYLYGATPAIWQATAGDSNSSWQQVGGKGAPVLHAITFNYNDVLWNGAPLYTPTEGDVLLNAWIGIVTPFSGTQPPYADIFVEESAVPWFHALLGHPLDATVADGDSLSVGLVNNAGGEAGANTDLITANVYATGSTPLRFVPARFASAQPVGVVVSVDGVRSGGAFVVADIIPSFPVVITEGVNDTFVYTSASDPNSPDTFTIAPGSYADNDALATAVGAATGAETTMSTYADVYNDRGTLAMQEPPEWGSQGNVDTITEGNGGAAAIGFTANPDTFAGGTGGDCGLDAGQGILYLLISTPVTE